MHRRHDRLVTRELKREFWARVALRNQWRPLPPASRCRASRTRSFVVGALIGVGAGVVALCAIEVFACFALLAVTVGPLAARG